MSDHDDASGSVIRTDRPPNQSDDEAKDIFEQHSDRLTDHSNQLVEQFGAACAAAGVEYAIAVTVDPDTGKPALFARGGTYGAAKLAKMALLQLRDQLVDELSV